VLSHRCVIGYLQLQSFLGARGLAMAGRTPGSPPVRLAPFPLFHVSGLSATVSTMMGAGVTVWPLGRFDPEAVIELTQRENVAVWGGATTHMMRLLDSPSIETLDPQQIVQISVGGSATTPALMRRTAERFPHLDNTMSSGYGSTETGGLATWAPNWMLQAAIDCVGPALPTVEVRITDETGEPVADGVEGNVEVRCPIVMLGYWRNDAANVETLLPGHWVRTGDFGRKEDGLLFLASRKRDLIIRGGENIYPFEIENRLDEHPDVLEAAVIGVEDTTLGQEVKAVVVVRPGSDVDADTLRAFCASTLASYKVPAEFDIRTSPLPRNATGKIMKHALAEEAPSIFVEE
jgi:acyl-CoA synthetase (AMP-forming)/AMP-acid ligase II